MERMTDKDIIKDFRDFIKTQEGGYITVLEFGDKRDVALERELDLFVAVLDLINRQQAEIEDLNRSRNGLLRKCVSAYHEGIKHFAERLCEDRVSNDPVVIAVKVELKEMVGDDK